MKISFKDNNITIDGCPVGYLSPSSQGCYAYLSEQCIGRFGKYKGMAGGAAEAKRWLKAALNKAGNPQRLLHALKVEGMSPIDYQMMPLPRRGKVAIRQSVRLRSWACIEVVGKRAHFLHGDTYVCEHSTRGILVSIQSDGYHLDVDGEEIVLSEATVQSIWRD